MARSAWKLKFVGKALSNHLDILSLETSSNDTKVKYKVLQTEARSSMIIEELIGCKIRLHDGKSYNRVAITEKQVGFKLGSLVLTKAMGSTIHTYNKVNQKKKERQRSSKQKKRVKISKKARLKLKYKQRLKLKLKLRLKKKKEI